MSCSEPGGAWRLQSLRPVRRIGAAELAVRSHFVVCWDFTATEVIEDVQSLKKQKYPTCAELYLD